MTDIRGELDRPPVPLQRGSRLVSEALPVVIRMGPLFPVGSPENAFVRRRRRHLLQDVRGLLGSGQKIDRVEHLQGLHLGHAATVELPIGGHDGTQDPARLQRNLVISVRHVGMRINLGQPVAAFSVGAALDTETECRHQILLFARSCGRGNRIDLQLLLRTLHFRCMGMLTECGLEPVSLSLGETLQRGGIVAAIGAHFTAATGVDKHLLPFRPQCDGGCVNRAVLLAHLARDLGISGVQQ